MRNPLKLFVLLLAMTSSVAVSQEISVEEAQSRAFDYLSNQTFGARRAKGANAMQLSLAYISKSDGETCYYVFNAGENDGFIIVGGDEVAHEILGYCDHGSFDIDKIPSNMKAWLGMYEKEIVRAKAEVAVKDAYTGRHAPAATHEERITIEALVPSRWDQVSPYNDQCIFDNDRCLTGCVATAMAQVMYYWGTVGINGETFRCGSKAVPSFTTETNKYYVDNLGSLDSFDWDNMVDEVNDDTDPEIKQAIAQLMRYCGQTIEMDYTSYSSFAYYDDILPALRDYFGYNSDMQDVYSEDLSADEWDEMVYGQLIDKKPVIIGAVSDEVGHCFICDGYNASTDEYNFNWGWGGYCDGWYKMSAMTPSEYDFSGTKQAVIDIMPLPLSIKEYAMLSDDETTLTFYYDNLYKEREGRFYDILYSWADGEEKQQGWYGNRNITDVVFDESFQEASPVSTSHWFHNLASLTNFNNLEYLNTSNVTDMSYMFSGCGLQSINLAYLNTSKVTNMAYMFAGDDKLTTIYCNDDWAETSQVTAESSEEMFANCNRLTGGMGFAYDESYDDISFANPSKYFTMQSTLNLIVLYDKENNAETISQYKDPSKANDVVLYDRTLYKDGSWNTLCLPFAMTEEQVRQQLAPEKLKTLSSSSFEAASGTLTLEFADATSIEAGKPYLIKWQKPGDYQGNEASYDITNPRFNDVFLLGIDADEYRVTTDYVDFVGDFSPISFTGADNDKLYLGGDNTLYYPSAEMTVNSCRGYFELQNGLTAGSTGPMGVRAFNISTEDEETEGIIDILPDEQTLTRWFTLDGRRLFERPTMKGMYINEGRKVLMK